MPVYGTRGFTSVATTAEIARRALGRDARTVLLQVGDHDPSGVSIFDSLVKDATTFVRQAVHVAKTVEEDDGGLDLGTRLGADEERMREIARGRAEPKISARRIAITWEQVEEYGLPTAPVSKTKSGGENPHGHDWVGETAQAEALPPDLLARIVKESIEGELDMDRYREEVDAEEADEEEIDEVLDR